MTQARIVWPWAVLMGLGAVSCLSLGAHEGVRRFELYRHGVVHEATVLAVGSTLSGNQRPIPHASVRVVFGNGRSLVQQLRTKGTRQVGERLAVYCDSNGSDCELAAPPGGRFGTVFGLLGFGAFLMAIAWISLSHRSPAA